jgi:hypothetical protein
MISSLLVDKKTYYSRLQICTSCDKFEKVLHRCSECGCIMPLKAKIANSTCPLNKWQQVDTSLIKDQ